MSDLNEEIAPPNDTAAKREESNNEDVLISASPSKGPPPDPTVSIVDVDVVEKAQKKENGSASRLLGNMSANIDDMKDVAKKKLISSASLVFQESQTATLGMFSTEAEVAEITEDTADVEVSEENKEIFDDATKTEETGNVEVLHFDILEEFTDMLPEPSEVLQVEDTSVAPEAPKAPTRKRSFGSLSVQILLPHMEQEPSEFGSIKTFQSFEDFQVQRSLSSSGTSFSTSTRYSSSVEEEVKIDRIMYYQLHALYTEQYRSEKRRNNFLQTKVADYYKSRKMFHVLYNERAAFPDPQKKYDRLLDELETVSENAAREQEAMEADVAKLAKKCAVRRDDIDLLFDKLQEREANVCKQLISEADGQSRRFVERYLKRQKNERTILTRMRQEYIKIGNKVNEKQEMLDDLDNLGPNLRLMDYEYLKVDNRNLSDKLEEKEMAISILRQQSHNISQILAHTREKSNAIEKFIEQYKDELGEISDELFDVREQVTVLKHERESYRNWTSKLKSEVGLLTRPKLLKDMSRAIEEITEGKHKLEEYMNTCQHTSNKVKEVRERINEILTEAKNSSLSLSIQ